MNEIITKEVILVTFIASTLAVLLLIGTIAWIVWAQNKSEKESRKLTSWQGFKTSADVDFLLEDEMSFKE